MRVTIEDLEALKELNDELEENHVETERSLHEEIGIYDVWRMWARCADCNPQN
jgi:dynactin 1